MKLITRLLFLLTCLFFLNSAALAQEPPLVLAFYYAWFDQNSWNSGQSVDLPETGYNSADRATIERHVAQAQSAGIDALVQSWYGPQVENNQTETNFRALLDMAQAKGFKVAVDFEVTSPFYGDVGAVTNGLSALLSTHAQHPAYLRYQGKPVVFFWRQQQYSVDQWGAIRNQIDPNRSSYWIAEGVDIDYQAVFDGHHLYSIAWADSPAGQLSKWGDQVRNYEAENQVDRLWVATAMPGYDDTRLPRDNAFAVPRRNGDYYRETWQGAVASQPNMIIINSFNEWSEGTHIEPSAAYGNLYLDVTRELVTDLRGSPPAAPPPAELQFAPPEEAAQATSPPNGPYFLTGSITNVRSGPATTFEVAGRLENNQTIPVVGRTESSDWWQIEFETGPDGKGWVSAEVVNFFGDAEAVPVVDAPELPVAASPEIAADEVEAAAGQTPESSEQPAAETPSILIPEGGVNIRTGPGLDFELLERLDAGTELPVVAKNETEEWWQVEYPATENGLAWVAAVVVDFRGDRDSVPVAGQNVAEGDALSPAALVITGSIEAIDPVNVRSVPSVEEGEVLGGLFPGETADVLAISEDGDWWQIKFADAPDQPAWVAAEFVRFTGEQNSIPIFGIGTVTPTPGPTDTPTPTATSTPTPTISAQQPTFAPTATSAYQATSAALLANRGTPEPIAKESNGVIARGSIWETIPWGILSVVAIIGFIWYQLARRRSS